MSQTQFLLLLVAIIPIFNCAITAILIKKIALTNIIGKFFPILFLAALIGLSGGISYDNNITFLKVFDNLNFSIALNDANLKFLFLLNFLWLVFAFYSHRFLRLSEIDQAGQLKLFFAAFIAVINLVLISRNFLSLLFFYYCLIFLCHFFAIKFFYKSGDKFSHFFGILFYLQGLLFFLVILLSHKFFIQTDFISGFAASGVVSFFWLMVIATICLIALFLPIIFPFYLLLLNAKIEPIFIYILFFLTYGFTGLIVFIKLVANIFNDEIYFLISKGHILIFLQWFFLAIITISAAFLFFANTIKKSFFHLFFQQLILTLFTTIIFAVFKPELIYLPLLSFSLLITLVFITVSNLLLYLNKAENKSWHGLFYYFKITITLLCFALIGFAGFLPSISMIEKFNLFKIVFSKDLFLVKIILLINFLTLVSFAGKLLYPMFLSSDNKIGEMDLELIKKMDNNSALSLSAAVVLLSLILSLLFI